MTKRTPTTLGTMAWRVARSCQGGACVSVAPAEGMILIGNSKDPDGAAMSYTVDEWREFVTGVKNGDFDDLG
jgi:hypothetical protein